MEPLFAIMPNASSPPKSNGCFWNWTTLIFYPWHLRSLQDFKVKGHVGMFCGAKVKKHKTTFATNIGNFGGNLVGIIVEYGTFSWTWNIWGQRSWKVIWGQAEGTTVQCAHTAMDLWRILPVWTLNSGWSMMQKNVYLLSVLKISMITW